MAITILAFIFVLGILIFIHELGHFIVAKKVGIKVEKFSLGFPPNIFSKKVGETTYCIGIIPLGGYVKMLGENPDEEGQEGTSGMDLASEEFMSKSVGQRAAVIFAGPFMNYVLAIAVMIGVYMTVGIPEFDTTRIVVGEVNADSPAEHAGLKAGDQIIALNGAALPSYDSMRTVIRSHPAAPLTFTWVRGGDTVSATITPRPESEPNAQGGIDTVGLIGVSQQAIGTRHYGVLEAVKYGFLETHFIVWETAKFVRQAITGQVSMRMVGGPVFIAQQAGREARKGAFNLFTFLALLSVNLAVLNVLPIPILDGGHLLFLLIEKLRGNPLSRRVRGIAQQVGIVFMFGLIIFVTYNDILRLFRGY